MNINKSVCALGALIVFAASTSAFAELCVEGKKTEVLWKGSWYKARIQLR